jgi:hypothetical protein
MRHCNAQCRTAGQRATSEGDRSVQRSSWGESVSTDEAHARFAGRRRYNAVRQLHATLRRHQFAELLQAAGGISPGVQARIAAHLGVSRATISRDVRAILRGLPSPTCPCCGALRAGALDRLEKLLASKQVAS